VHPVSFAVGDVIYTKGEPSRELLFLLEGQVDVTSPNNQYCHIERRLTPTTEIYLPEGAHNAPLPRPFCGCFGETVITGHRRQSTHVARTYCETLIVTQKDLVRIFAANPRPAKRIIHAVIDNFRRKQRLRSLTLKIALFMAPRGSDLWAALTMQLIWDRYSNVLLCRPPAELVGLMDDWPQPDMVSGTRLGPRSGRPLPPSLLTPPKAAPPCGVVPVSTLGTEDAEDTLSLPMPLAAPLALQAPSASAQLPPVAVQTPPAVAPELAALIQSVEERMVAHIDREFDKLRNELVQRV